MTRSLLALVAGMAVLLLVRSAGATTTVQAPAGGRVVTLPDGLVACATSAGEWAVEADPHAVRPPASEAAVGHVASVRVATAPSGCAASTTVLDLVTTAHLPQIDAGSISLAIDDARLDLRGRGLRGVGVHWQQGDRTSDDRCAQPEVPAGAAVERCSFSVARGISADSNAAGLTYFPAGGRPASADVATFDATGRRVPVEELVLRPARVVVTALVPPSVSVDLAGDASRIPLTHPEAVSSVDCGASACELEGGAVVVRAVRNTGQALAIRLRLAPHVLFAKGETLDAAPSFQVGVLPCAMSIVSGEALRGVDDSAVVVKLDARCAAEASALRFSIGAQPARVLKVVSDAGAAFVLVRAGHVETDDLVVTAQRGETDASMLGVARVHTRRAPQPHATLELTDGRPIDFIPTNRAAILRYGSAEDHGRLVPLSLEGVYDVSATPSATEVRGVKGAAGFVAVRFGYRVDALPGPLATTDLAVLVDPIQRPLHEANVPAALGASAMSAQPLVELVCEGSPGVLVTIPPGAAEHIPFSSRDTCRVVFHKERLAPEEGTQRLTLDVDVTRVDGEARPAAHVSQPIVLRPGGEPRYAFLKGIVGPFDHVTVRVFHDTDESHYVGTDELLSGAPPVQWSVIAGKGKARIYATTAIPTGLYRVSDRSHSGILTLNFGVVARFTWLDDEGHDGFLGAEAGVMGVGLANDVDSSGHSLTQVATVWGAGLSVPIANRSLATETSINLHAWGEYEVSRALGSQPGTPLGFVFGPSISIGNIGTNL